MSVTVFLRVLEASVDEKSQALLRAVTSLHDDGRNDDVFQSAVFQRDPRLLSAVPGRPFAYWASDAVGHLFMNASPFELRSHGRLARRGVGTNDDFRFLRLWTEVDADGWILLAKGGTYSQWYADLSLMLNWMHDGCQLKAFFIGGGESPSRNIRSEAEYKRLGLTWPLRTQSGFGVRVMPTGCVFGSKGPAAFVDCDSPNVLLALLAITTSTAFCYLVELQTAFGSYEVGVIQRTPVPDLSVS